MKVSFDLSLASTNDLVAELKKRSPAGAITLLYQTAPGAPPQTRNDAWGRSDAEALGILAQGHEMGLQTLRRGIAPLAQAPQDPLKPV